MNDQQHEHGDEGELDFVAPEKGSVEELLDASSRGPGHGAGAGHQDPLDPMRHSAAHVMAEAVLDLFPGTRLGIGPAIDGGFYYDFDLPRALVPEDLPAIEERMRSSIAADHLFIRKEWDPDEGRQFLAGQGQRYKVEILDDLRTAATISGEPPPVRGGRLLAGPRGPTDAPADLWHGLEHPGGAGPVPVAS
jgi:hypothetical protein